MSISSTIGRVARVAAYGIFGAVAVSQLATGHPKHPAPPPGKLPFLADDVPSRRNQLDALRGSSAASPFDLLIIGGGATGCGIALDAATRGLRVALVEREDFGAGTSSRSTKLVHGGVRYLEKAFFQADPAQLKLVFHALAERASLLRNSPHLSHPLPTMTPCYAWWELPYYWAGLKFYDLLAGRNMIHLSRFVTAKESIELFPTLASKRADGSELLGTVVYYDGQMDDARLNVAVAVTAAQAGAVTCNHTEVLRFGRNALTGRIGSARVRDTLTGKEFDVHAKVVVNATGPFCDSLRQLADPRVAPLVTPSMGVHVVLPDYCSPAGLGLIIPRTADGRVMFLLPWEGRTLAGTTDSAGAVTKWPVPTQEDVQFILDGVSDYLSIKLVPSDVLSAWSGIRPLVAEDSGGAEKTGNLHRDHVVSVGEEGLVTVTGGKWTTYRSMAEDVVDVTVKLGGLNPANTCITEHLPLAGAQGYDPVLFTTLTKQFVRCRRERGRGRDLPPLPMDVEIAQHLARAYGGEAATVAGIAQNEFLGEKLSPNHPVLEAEVAYAARHEYCETVCDFLARRSRLAFLDKAAALQAIPRVAEILSNELKWDRRRQSREVQEAHQFLDTFGGGDSVIKLSK